MEVAEPRLRLILHDFLSIDLCKELEFIHKSCCTVGYRPNVLSTTLSHLIATNCAHLIMPFVSIRERLKEKVEEFFGCEYELFVEFTGLISWTKGARIGWHSDDNRSYLKQRDFAAVCYLNNHGKDFKGGHFHFQDGEPTVIVPVAGDAIFYTADDRNIHSVDEITDGERITLTLWFTRDSCHDEDAKLITLLSEGLLFSSVERELLSCLPLLAPSNMYWFSQDQASRNKIGFDIRWARLHVLGYTIYAIDSEIIDSTSDSMCDHSELVMEPLWLARGGEIFKKEFVNSLHALQIVQFYCWKATDLQDNTTSTTSGNVIVVSQSFMESSRNLKPIPQLCDESFVKTVFHFNKETGLSLTWAGFAASIFAWEEYTSRLHRQLRTSLPYWRNNQSIFYVS